MTQIGINILIILFLPLLLNGMISRFKSFWTGKKGASIFQGYYDFYKYLQKGEVVSRVTSFVFQISSTVITASVLFASLLIPITQAVSVISFPANFVLFCYMLALGRFFSIISALDTGSGFEGMGANREGLLSILVEPSIFIILGSVLLLSNQVLTFSEFMVVLNNNNAIFVLVKILTICVLFFMLLTEACRIPVDDPKTHLELTMIHEVMILDNSGPDLAFFLYTNGLKMLIFASLIINLILPYHLVLPLFLFLYLVLLVVISFLIATVESVMARFRIPHIPQFLFLMISLAMIIFSLIFLFLSGGFN